MATIYTHAVAGLAVAGLCAPRPMPWPYWCMAALLPIIPDLDVFSTLAYGAPLGHRGITHSLAFAALVGAAAAAVTFRYFRVRWWLLACVFFIILASHGLLDACNKRSMEIPFFWPLETRYGNWGPLPVSDLAFELPDPRTSRAVRSELVWVWLPLGVLVGLVTAYRRLRRVGDREIA
jgi:inner membrane protein